MLKNIKLSLILLFLATSYCAYASGTKTQNKTLPATISQEQWVEAKQSIQLPSGINLKYVEMGKPGAPVIIFLHGMTDNSRSWSLLAPYFADKYHIFMLDQRGHGDSDKPDLRMYSVSDYAVDLAEFMTLKKIDKAHIVGHSLGSMTAQTFAVNYPEKTDKVVLIASAPVEFESLGRDIYDAVLGFGDNHPDDEFMDAWYSNPNPIDENFLNREKKESKNIPPHAWRAITKGAAFSHLTPFMHELKAPVLLVWGDADSFFSKKHQDALRAQIPQAKFVPYSGVGHNIQWEIPGKLAKSVRIFLDK